MRELLQTLTRRRAKGGGGTGKSRYVRWREQPPGNGDVNGYIAFSELQLYDAAGSNVAPLAVQITASEQNSAQEGPQNLIDGSPDNYWASQSGGATRSPYVILDFGEGNGVTIASYAMIGRGRFGGDSADVQLQSPRNWDLSVSDDAQTWTVIANGFGQSDWGDRERRVFSLDRDKVYYLFKLGESQGPDQFTGLSKFEIFDQAGIDRTAMMEDFVASSFYSNAYRERMMLDNDPNTCWVTEQGGGFKISGLVASFRKDSGFVLGGFALTARMTYQVSTPTWVQVLSQSGVPFDATVMTPVKFGIYASFTSFGDTERRLYTLGSNSRIRYRFDFPRANADQNYTGLAEFYALDEYGNEISRKIIGGLASSYLANPQFFYPKAYDSYPNQDGWATYGGSGGASPSWYTIEFDGQGFPGVGALYVRALENYGSQFPQTVNLSRSDDNQAASVIGTYDGSSIGNGDILPIDVLAKRVGITTYRLDLGPSQSDNLFTGFAALAIQDAAGNDRSDLITGVAASSFLPGVGFDPAKVLDKDPSTAWATESTKGGTKPSWFLFRVPTASNVPVAALVMTALQNYASQFPTTIQVSKSVDGGPYQVIKAIQVNPAMSNGETRVFPLT